jgi:hypothetical protein
MNLQSDKVFYHCKPVMDKLAFEDAQIMARIAYSKCNQSFWAAAMLALEEAYKG